MIKQSLYKILGLPDFASVVEIKRAFRSLAFRHHPDKGGDPETMKMVSAAYGILSKRKNEYDAGLRRGGTSAVIIRRESWGWSNSTDNATVFTWTFYS